MSKGTRLRAQPASRPRFRSSHEAMAAIRMGRHRPGVEVAIMPAACRHTEELIAQLRQATHDDLIKLLGRRRCSGIWWSIEHGTADCRRRLDDMYPPADQRDGEVVAMLAKFHEYFEALGDDAVLIVAACEATTS